MPIHPDTARQIAADHTAAWNSGSPQAVASFHAEAGRITINRGTPWEGRAGVAAIDRKSVV